MTNMWALLQLLPFLVEGKRVVASLSDMRAASDAAFIKVSEGSAAGCPEGLTKTKENKNQCFYHQDQVENRTGEESSIVFDKGSIDVEKMFEKELIMAVEDNTTTDFAKSVFVELKEVDHHMHADHSAVATLKHMKHKVHEATEGLQALEFIAHHSLEHVMLHVVGHGLAHASHGVGALGVAALGMEAISNLLSSPVIIGMQVLLAWVKHSRAQILNHLKVANYAVALIHKSTCSTIQLNLASRALTVKSLKPHVSEVCPPNAQKVLLEQIVKTNNELLKMFSGITKIGQCLWPGGKEAPSKTRCLKSVMEVLHHSGDHMGILFSSVTMAAMYASVLDGVIDLGGESLRGWMKLIWNVFSQENGLAQESLKRKSIAQETSEIKAISCAQLKAVQVAFEQVFANLRIGLRVWMQTYSRDTMVTAATTSWYPCQKAVNKLGANNFCKSSDFPRNRMPGQDKVCNIAMNNQLY